MDPASTLLTDTTRKAALRNELRAAGVRNLDRPCIVELVDRRVARDKRAGWSYEDYLAEGRSLWPNGKNYGPFGRLTAEELAQAHVRITAPKAVIDDYIRRQRDEKYGDLGLSWNDGAGAVA
jgi:hypothetical protein